MDVFISWSGNRSKFVAEQLKGWLKKVIQVINPWMSSADLLAGARWNAEISKRLANTKFGIICVTPENLSEPWIQFEAGALAKTIDNSTYVCPYLVVLEEIDARNPLSQFQCKRATREGTFDILHSIHTALIAARPDTNLSEAEVKEQFEQWWPQLEDKLNQMPPAAGAETPEEADPLNEVLTLTRSIAASVSTLQKQAAVTYVIGPPWAHEPTFGPALNTSDGLFSRLLREAEVFRMVGMPYASPAFPAIKGEALPPEEPVRKEAAAATKEHAVGLKIACPGCGETAGISVVGLARDVEDGSARHLNVRCERCAAKGEGGLAVHIARSGKSQTPCPDSCPHHPRGTRV